MKYPYYLEQEDREHYGHNVAHSLSYGHEDEVYSCLTCDKAMMNRPAGYKPKAPDRTFSDEK